MKNRARRRTSTGQLPQSFELNVMPFIDIFSLLCTFLLFSAVFVAIGIHTVQIPFFTNAAPDKKDDVDKRALVLSVDVSRTKVSLTSSFSKPPTRKKTSDFPLTDDGLIALHQALVGLKGQNPEADLVTLYASDDVPYQQLIKVLDQIRLAQPDDPVDTAQLEGGEGTGAVLFPKVVIGSVVL